MQLPPVIAAALEAGDVVITSSARGARALRRLHAASKHNEGHEAWLSAAVLPWDSWLHQLWHSMLRTGKESRLLLTPLQEQQIWARLVEPTIAGRHLISVLGVSQLAQSAYALLCAYEAQDFLRGDLFAGFDVEHFRGWARQFQRECRDEGWQSGSLLPLALLEAVGKDQLVITGRFVLVGFDRVTPAQQKLIDALREKGHSVELAQSNATAPVPPPQLVRAADKHDELATCALWVRSQLEALGITGHIAVVVPGAAAMRPEIERTFRQVLAPETALMDADDLPPPFEFSLGVPLAQLPMVRAALLLLRWMRHGLLQDEASWLVLSGLLCKDEDEQLSIARFDARLRQQAMRPPEQDLDGYLRLLDKAWTETAKLGMLRRRLLKAQRAMPTNSELSFADWVQRARLALEAAGWPGAHAHAGEDYQVQARWSQLLDAMATLAFDGSVVSYHGFLLVMEQQARQTIYAPESRDAPVQIIGPFETAGLTFDAVWFLGADDANWPAVAKPHPFLLRSLQRRYEMPHANNDVDWKLAQQVTTRLTQSAPVCLFSHALQNAEGACRPSTLIPSDATKIQAEAFRKILGIGDDLAAMHNFPATVLDAEPAVVVPWPAGKPAGGAEVLRDQAACPFRSFAKRRLGARPVDESDWDLDPRVRGSLVHAVLEKVWAALRDRDGLLRARDEGRLTALLNSALHEALQKFREDGIRRDWNTAYLDAEHDRFLSIIEDWLAYEAERADFTVEAREDARTAAVGDLQLQLRVDRVDQVAGGRVIVDYKTGVVKTDSWDGSRPEDPQLPIYAGFGEVENLQGVLLGRVAEGKPEFVGRVMDHRAVLANKPSLSRPPYSQSMLQEWKENLLTLAQQFLWGEAQVDPKRYPKTCQYCDLPGLCRVAESERGSGDAGADEGDGDSE